VLELKQYILDELTKVIDDQFTNMYFSTHCSDVKKSEPLTTERLQKIFKEIEKYQPPRAQKIILHFYHKGNVDRILKKILEESNNEFAKLALKNSINCIVYYSKYIEKNEAVIFIQYRNQLIPQLVDIKEKE